MLEGSNDFPQNLLVHYGTGRSRYRAIGAWMADEIVGVLTGSFDSNFFESGAFDSFDLPTAPHAFLDRVHVHESARGQGAGRALVEEYVRHASGYGCSFVGGQIDLSTESTSRRAFFENLGFTIRDLDNFGATPEQVLSRR
jgi:GNAT superfamily N-acetyltransferase